MTSPTLKFKKVVKDQLFYNRFEYCISFGLAEAAVLRGLDYDLIDARLDQRIEWREMARKRWKSSMVSNGWNEITAEIRADLHQVCALLLESKVEHKLVVSTHFGWVYTNNADLIDRMRVLRCLTGKHYTQAVINRPKNTILLKKSNYANRAYLYNIKLNVMEKESLANFFINQKEHIRPSPSLTSWFDLPYLRTQDYFFIDYNGDEWLTMLSLIRPGLIRKTSKIITK